VIFPGPRLTVVHKSHGLSTVCLLERIHKTDPSLVAIVDAGCMSADDGSVSLPPQDEDFSRLNVQASVTQRCECDIGWCTRTSTCVVSCLCPVSFSSSATLRLPSTTLTVLSPTLFFGSTDVCYSAWKRWCWTEQRRTLVLQTICKQSVKQRHVRIRNSLLSWKRWDDRMTKLMLWPLLPKSTTVRIRQFVVCMHGLGKGGQGKGQLTPPTHLKLGAEVRNCKRRLFLCCVLTSAFYHLHPRPFSFCVNNQHHFKGWGENQRIMLLDFYPDPPPCWKMVPERPSVNCPWFNMNSSSRQQHLLDFISLAYSRIQIGLAICY